MSITTINPQLPPLEVRPNQFMEELEASAEIDKQKTYSKELRFIAEDVLRWAELYMIKNGGQFLRPNESREARYLAFVEGTALPDTSKETPQWEVYIKLLQQSVSDIASAIEKHNHNVNCAIICLADLTSENQKLFGLLETGCRTRFNPEYPIPGGVFSIFERSARERYIPTLEQVVTPGSLYHLYGREQWVDVTVSVDQDLNR